MSPPFPLSTFHFPPARTPSPRCISRRIERRTPNASASSRSDFGLSNARYRASRFLDPTHRSGSTLEREISDISDISDIGIGGVTDNINTIPRNELPPHEDGKMGKWKIGTKSSRRRALQLQPNQHDQHDPIHHPTNGTKDVNSRRNPSARSDHFREDSRRRTRAGGRMRRRRF